MTTTHANQVGSGPQARSLPLPRGSGFHPRPVAVTNCSHGILAFALLLVLLFPLRNLLLFSPSAVRDGQWWRLVTHPFVHVSWYHLLLDGAAFLLLYSSLRESSRRRRFVFIAVSVAGSLGAAWMFAPQIEQLGLCGLSGIAHGLMAVTALELIRADQKIGWLFLASVTGKALWEATTGQVFFSWLHFGMLGTPIAICHLGGVLGGVLAWTGVHSRLETAKRRQVGALQILP